MTVRAPVALADLTEKEWQAQVIELAQTLGWKHYFTYRSKRSPAGWPDLQLVRERVLFLELKTEAGKLSHPQRQWLRALTTAGAEAYVCRPRHLPKLAAVLAVRRYPVHVPFNRSARDAADHLREELAIELATVKAA